MHYVASSISVKIVMLLVLYNYNFTINVPNVWEIKCSSHVINFFIVWIRH